ncbi:MAG: VTT domain-containing protein [Candidatus Aminicenantales bacterium]
MNDRNKTSEAFLAVKNKKLAFKTKTLIFLLQLAFILALLVIWISSPSIRSSKSLWVLFFYSFPSEFLIAAVPHEPVLIYFGKFYAPLTVAAVGIIGTLMTETLNYSVFRYITDLNAFQKIRHKRAVTKVIELFQKKPFIALFIAGITPIPFYPFRFLVVLARYPRSKYILALFLSRTPRFYILAYLGHAINIPDSLLIALFVVLIASMNINILRNYLKKKKDKKEDAS